MSPDDSPHPPLPDSQLTHEASEQLPGEQLGPYRLLQKIGEGGMGEVWVAEQREPIRRTVAVKVIKVGMDTRQVVARFDAERQALALMDHPCIARVLDAGTTARGRAYFVMEYVRGERFTDYCDRNRLSTAERLQLFTHVCEAVQHAHQKGIIHRDLKPSNVLVAMQDGQPVPKIIDFGIAKATAQRLTEQTVFTELGVLIGTPEYMSPEQAEMTGLDVDTRTDVYSLGVMLYELLAGVLPFDPKTLRQAGLDAVRRQIREVEPPRPSTKVSTRREASAEAAHNRRTEPARLASQLRGDLDWITMKCLEKDRTRRYASASELAADVTRYLRHEPVLASPPSRIYRAKKFVKRHRVGVASSALIVLALVAGIAGTTIGMLRAVSAERRANEEAEAARQVSDFLMGLFAVSEPNEAKGNTVTAREILDKGAEKIGRELGGQPRVQRRLLVIMGRVYQSLGLYQKSAALKEQALRVSRSIGEYDADVAGAQLELAWLYRFQGRLDEAIALCREGLALSRKQNGEVHAQTGRAVRLLGILLRDKGDYPEAQRLLENSIVVFEKTLGPDDQEVAGSLYHLGWLQKLTGHPADAKRSYERALRIWETKAGTDNTYFAWCLNDLAVVNEDLGDYDASRRLQERSLAIKTKLLGPEHPDVAAALNNLCALSWHMKDYNQAAAFCERALAIREKTLGPDHGEVAGTLDNLGLVYRDLGDAARSRQYFERALAIFGKGRGADTPPVAEVLLNLGSLHERTHDRAAMGAAYERALAIYERVPGSSARSLGEALFGVARASRAKGDNARAAAMFERLTGMIDRVAESDRNLALEMLGQYGRMLREQGRADAAAAVNARADAIRARK